MTPREASTTTSLQKRTSAYQVLRRVSTFSAACNAVVRTRADKMAYTMFERCVSKQSKSLQCRVVLIRRQSRTSFAWKCQFFATGCGDRFFKRYQMAPDPMSRPNSAVTMATERSRKHGVRSNRKGLTGPHPSTSLQNGCRWCGSNSDDDGDVDDGNPSNNPAWELPKTL